MALALKWRSLEGKWQRKVARDSDHVRVKKFDTIKLTTTHRKHTPAPTVPY